MSELRPGSLFSRKRVAGGRRALSAFGVAVAVAVLGMVLDGLDAVEVTLEARFSDSLRSCDIKVVGLAEAPVKEGMFRARSALWSLVQEVAVRQRGILVNLAPADLRKTGRSLDLPLAMVYASLLLGLPAGRSRTLVFLGELGLGGVVRPVPGVLAAVLAAKGRGRAGIVLPEADLAEARLVEGPDLYPVPTVEAALRVLAGEGIPDAAPRGPRPSVPGPGAPDLADVRGQFHARRALEIAAAGGHNLLLEGPPGSGKTMLARRLPSVLPKLTDAQALEVARIRSVVGTLDPERIHDPPFRCPHHSATPAGLAGGGQPLRPGEFSQAHHGVLFLDEFPEFDRRALEVLREPMEGREVHLTRAGGARRLPASFLCVAAMNPCPCGFYGLRDGRCTCTPRRRHNYRARISGPLLDRFDLRVLLRPVPARDLWDGPPAESSAAVRERVVRARTRQRERYPAASPRLNALVPDRLIHQAAGYRSAEKALLLRMVASHRLSARAARKVERVARTLADLAGSEPVQDLHLMEALAFRLTPDLENAPGPPLEASSS